MHTVHDLRRVDLNLLVVLDALLTEKNISRAAERLAMTQPAVSHALARLRALLDDRILVRVGNEMRPTARAKAMIVPLAEALARVRDVVLPSGFDPANCRRVFRLAISDYGCAVVLPKLLKDLRTLAPGVDLMVSKGGRLETLRQVSDGELDGAAGVFSMLTEDLRQQVLFEEQFVVVTDRRNVGKNGGFSLQQYLSAPHVHVSTEGLHHSHVDHALTAIGARRRLMLVVPYWLSAIKLLPGADLVLTVASKTVEGVELPESLVVLSPPFKVPNFEFVYLWRADAESDPEAMWLRSLIAASCVG